MKRAILILGVLLGAWGCSTEVTYHPAPQLLPQHIQSIAVRPFVNQTQQFGLEDRLLLRVLDEFQRDGTYKTLPESLADGYLAGKVSRYILTPIQYDPNLVPTAYKLQVFVDLQFVDRIKNQVLWEEPNLEGTLTYNAATRPGGLTEEQARDSVWDILAPTIVARTVQGFGAATGTSQRKVSSPTPAEQKAPPLPSPPMQQEPY